MMNKERGVPVSTYSDRVLIHNWSEDRDVRALRETEKRFQQERTIPLGSSGLTIQLTRLKISEKLNKPASLTFLGGEPTLENLGNSRVKIVHEESGLCLAVEGGVEALSLAFLPDSPGCTANVFGLEEKSGSWGLRGHPRLGAPHLAAALPEKTPRLDGEHSTRSEWLLVPQPNGLFALRHRSTGALLGVGATRKGLIGREAVVASPGGHEKAQLLQAEGLAKEPRVKSGVGPTQLFRLVGNPKPQSIARDARPPVEVDIDGDDPEGLTTGPGIIREFQRGLAGSSLGLARLRRLLLDATDVSGRVDAETFFWSVWNAGLRPAREAAEVAFAELAPSGSQVVSEVVKAFNPGLSPRRSGLVREVAKKGLTLRQLIMNFERHNGEPKEVNKLVMCVAKRELDSPIPFSELCDLLGDLGFAIESDAEFEAMIKELTK